MNTPRVIKTGAFCLAALPGLAFSATKTVPLLLLNDFHAHLTSHPERVSDGQGGTTIEQRGGIARIATLVKEARSENPNTLLMNVGDTAHGGVESFYSMGNSIIGPINALGVDVGVAGNWDYYYTPAVTRMRYGAFNGGIVQVRMPGFDEPMPVMQYNYPNLGANLTDIMDFMPGLDFMPATHMITVDGIDVGFIGLTSDIVEAMHPMLAEGFNFAQGEEAHKDLINEHAADLRAQGADIVVVMSELGIHKNKRLADIIDPGVTAIFTAHTHEVTEEPIQSASGALVVEAGNDAYLGRMDVTFDVRRRSTTIVDVQWSLLDVDMSVPADPDMAAMVEEARAEYLDENVALVAPPFMSQRLTQPIDTVIGHTHTLMDRKHSLESTFNNGWGDMLLDITGAEIAMSPGFRMGTAVAGSGYTYEDGAIATGEITIEDAYRFFPMYYAIVNAEVSGARLKEIVEQQLTRTYSSEPFNHVGGWNYGFAGLDMTVDLAAGDGNRITSLRAAGDGHEISDDETVSVAGCQRLPFDFPGHVCSYDGFSNITSLGGPYILAESAVDVFIQAIGEMSFDGGRDSIIDTNNTVMWPEGDYIQPLEGVGEDAIAPPEGDNCGFFKFQCGTGGGFGGGFLGGR